MTMNEAIAIVRIKQMSIGMLMPSSWLEKNMEQYSEAMTMVLEAADDAAKKEEKK